MRAEEWSLVGLWCLLIPLGIWTALKPPARARARSKSVRLTSWAGVLIGAGMLCDVLPRLFGWSYGAGMVLSTIGLLSAVAAVILIALNTVDFLRLRGGRLGPIEPGADTAGYGGPADGQ